MGDGTLTMILIARGQGIVDGCHDDDADGADGDTGHGDADGDNEHENENYSDDDGGDDDGHDNAAADDDGDDDDDDDDDDDNGSDYHEVTPGNGWWNTCYQQLCISWALLHLHPNFDLIYRDTQCQ